MKTSGIVKYKDFPQEAKKYMLKEEYDGINVGDLYIAKEATIIKVQNITFDKTRKPIDHYSFKIEWVEAKDWQATEWGSKHTATIWDFQRYFPDRTLVTKSIKEHWDEAVRLMEGKVDIEEYQDKQSDTLNSETALIHRSSKESLLALQQGMQEKRHRAELMKKFVGYEMERRRQEMEKFREKLNGIIADFRRKISKIMRVITTIELYLGIKEELFQIQEGETAPSGTPISFRQQVLYMDEEIGHWKDGGLDWTNIKWFDNWLLKPENLQQVFPEAKGLVVFRPRRYTKDYGTDDYAWSSMMNEENQYRTYLLIRNGDNLYRVYTENITILPRLFPLRKEFAAMLADMEKEMKDAEGWSNEDERKLKAKDKIDDMMYEYKKRAVLLQGLIDRTEVFHPLPADKINIFNLDELGDKVQFIYDDEATLPTGRLPFGEWRKKINELIAPGSRIVITGYWGGAWSSSQGKNWKDRLYYYCNDYSVPNVPSVGVYTVEEYPKKHRFTLCETQFEIAKKIWAERKVEFKVDKFEETGYLVGYTGWGNPEFPMKPLKKNEGRYYVIGYSYDLTIKHNPGGETRHGWDDWEGHERKNRIRFKIYKTDHFLINYDQISLDDIEFYLKSRVDRPNYLFMMPALEALHRLRTKELKGEQMFVELAFYRNYGKTLKLSEDEVRDRIHESIRWWKYKNKWKRPIAKDDTLALRMIEKRIQSKNYTSFEHHDID